jgi:hypothetical protein
MDKLEQVFDEVQDIFRYYQELEACSGVGYKSRFKTMRARLESAVLKIGRLLVEQSFDMGEKEDNTEFTIECTQTDDGEYRVTVPQFESISCFSSNKDYALYWIFHVMADVFADKLHIDLEQAQRTLEQYKYRSKN